MISATASFIRRNIVVVLSVPPIIVLGFGVYAKIIRPQPNTSAPAAEHTLKTEKS